MTQKLDDAPYQTVEFPSDDGLLITADYYSAPQRKGFLVLCHRSHCNRAEYRETAPRWVRLGFSCLAIDQRSGMKVFGEVNETARRAKQQKLPTGYLDAKIDVEAAVRYGFHRNEEQPVILVGSSYSGSLALICSVNNDKVDAVLAFSPGEYLRGVSVEAILADLRKPCFVTSSRAEIDDTATLVQRIPERYRTQYRPEVEGFHGSKMLWSTVVGSEVCRQEVERFLMTRVGP